MITDYIKKWADLLLDTGKRSNLVNFKDYKMNTVEIISPDLETLFERAGHSAGFEVYNPGFEDDEEDITFDAEATEFQNDNVTKDLFLKAYGRKLRRQQILLYNRANKPIAALQKIDKKAKSAIEETGVNIAYIAMGFINWTESENSRYIMRAPILLAPIVIDHKSAVDPFNIRILTEEIIVNPTFAFKLQNEYGITLPEFDEDYGIGTYFESVNALVSKLRWSISTECKIGLFSFLKINMYNDLKNNEELISRNRNILALLGEDDSTSFIDEGNEEQKADLLTLHNVVDADSSQTEAIEMAKRGQSFVLQGPPGTGKSQTITNIISECLFDGKKVLFVSEKLAALNVVYDKLNRVGLEEFCLQLHSHKANKKQVIEELCHTLKLPRSGVSELAGRELKAKEEAQQKLDGYVAELHKVRSGINKSLYRLFGDVAACRTAPDLDYVINNLSAKDGEYLDKAESLLSKYAEYTPSIGYDYHNNIWYGYKNPDCSFQAKIRLKSDLTDMAELCGKLQEIEKCTAKDYKILIHNLFRAHTYSAFFELVGKSGFITPEHLNPQTAKKTLGILKSLQELSRKILETKTVLDNVFDNDVYKLDGSDLYRKLTKQFSGAFSRIFKREYRTILKSIKLCKKDGKSLNYASAVNAMYLLGFYQKNSEKFNSLQVNIKDIMGREYKGVNTDFVQCVTDMSELIKVQEQGVTFGQLPEMAAEEFAEQKEIFNALANKFRKVFSDYKDAENRLLSGFDLNLYNLAEIPFKTLIEKCNGCLNGVEVLDNWCEFVKFVRCLDEAELHSFVDCVIEKKLETDKIVLTYKKAFYTQWIDLILHDSPILLELGRIPHDEAVKCFKEKDKVHFEVNKAIINAKLSAQRPTLDMVAKGSSIAVLMREGEKKRKQKSIRALLSEISDLAQNLKPCFLMSPLSVSTFLSADMEFDVVIFDEASQVFPQDAIGAIYRGKQLIVVGDSKQMPPSNFFNSSMDADTDEEEDITDFESILDLCSSSLPQCRQKWHYRSRFEQLISFSNKNFYDNELITFPSSKQDREGIGIDYVYVDGVFDRKSKTNRAEAERIVDLVYENIEKYPERSLGVVAFSISQQELIDKLIQKRRQQDTSKEFFFKEDRVEPFFVKNLETVQGDERDTIIFSVAYAKDAEGRLLLNFGPINKNGGERRLNVAVTRAKVNVQLVSSMHYTDIDLSRTQSVGAKLLREYLDYAENGNIALKRAISVSPYEQSDSEFEAEVCEFLRENGYKVDTQVGCSSFKIDLAIKNPNTSDYTLAIECDGATYRSSKTARDRDRLRQEILERMGWKFYRIWSTDWFRNKNGEKERLLTAVQKSFDCIPQKTEKNIVDVSFENTLETQHFEFPKYQTLDERSVAKRYNNNIFGTVKALAQVEAPLSEEWLLKRICFLFGREKVTRYVTGEYERIMSDCQKAGIVRRDGFLYLNGQEAPMLRVPEKGDVPREIKYISEAELANGLKELLKQNISAGKTGLFKLLVEQLGFSRIGDSAEARLESALEMIANDIEIDGDILSLKTSAYN